MTDSKPPEQRHEQGQEKWYERMRYQILLFTGGIALFVLVGGWILDWYIAPQTSAQKKDLVQSLGLITAGVAGAVGIYFTWRGQRQARLAQEENQRSTQEQISLTRQSQEQNQQATQAQLENAQEELRLTRVGQITERFTRAIDQLGNESLEIRLGAIYALERIAKESKDDHWPIMEVLTAYVRLHAPWSLAKGQQGEEDAAGEESEEHYRELAVVSTEVPTGVPVPAPDIRAIMTVLRGRKRHYRLGEPERLDLRETNLSGAFLLEANLSGADFRRANLSIARLSEANLSKAYLSEVNLSGASLHYARLSEASLGGADFRGANLSGANLSAANLKGACLSGAVLSGTDLSGADLSGASLLRTRYLFQAQLEATMMGDEHTQLPSDLKPPAHWNVRTDEQSEEN